LIPTAQTTPGGTVNLFKIGSSGNQAFNSPNWSLYLNGPPV
jgi:hypothetical protein